MSDMYADLKAAVEAIRDAESGAITGAHAAVVCGKAVEKHGYALLALVEAVRAWAIYRSYERLGAIQEAARACGLVEGGDDAHNP